MSTKLATLLAGAVTMVFGASAANADQIAYVGAHPVHVGDAYCHIEAPHVHTYRPAKTKKQSRLLYRVVDDHYHFVGDPKAHGYEGPAVSYYGHHPVQVTVEHGAVIETPERVEYCYINGPHWHAYAPPPELEFTVKGDAHWYVGSYPEVYEERKPALVRINAVYRPIEFERPVIEVEPPAAYVGPVVEVRVPAKRHRPRHRARPRARAGVRAGIGVEFHVPSVEVEVGVPGVVIEEHHHHRHRKVKKRRHWKHKKHKKWKKRRRHRH